MHKVCKKSAKHRISMHEVCTAGIKKKESLHKVCTKADFTSFKVCKTSKKSAKSLQKVCKTSKKVCIYSAKCTLCRLMRTFEKVCTSLPPNVPRYQLLVFREAIDIYHDRDTESGKYKDAQPVFCHTGWPGMLVVLHSLFSASGMPWTGLPG